MEAEAAVTTKKRFQVFCFGLFVHDCKFPFISSPQSQQSSNAENSKSIRLSILVSSCSSGEMLQAPHLEYQLSSLLALHGLSALKHFAREDFPLPPNGISPKTLLKVAIEKVARCRPLVTVSSPLSSKTSQSHSKPTCSALLFIALRIISL